MEMASLLETMPFAGTIGMKLLEARPGTVKGQLSWRDDLCTSGGLLHGGTLMAFADTLGGICAFLNLPEGAGTATIESKTNFFRGVRDGRLLGTSRPLHVGRTTIAVQTELHDETGRMVGIVTQTQAVLAPR